MDKKTVIIITGILIFVIVALVFGFDMIVPVVDPMLLSMIKIFLCGAVCGMLAGFWLGYKFERGRKVREG